MEHFSIKEVLYWAPVKWTLELLLTQWQQKNISMDYVPYQVGQ